MKITTDWHIHSRNSCDGACMAVSTLIDEACGKGIRNYGLTDHLHTPYNRGDIAASRAEFLSSQPPPNFRFGIEVSCVSKWELAEIAAGRCDNPVYGIRSGGPPGGEIAIGITAGELEELDVEYVIGGVHWPIYLPAEREPVIRDYHRQNMFLARHPLVDIVAHPWWWMGYWQAGDGRYPDEPWLGDFRRIPASMHEEFADALTGHDTVAEININAILTNGQYPERFAWQYLEYIAYLHSRGVKLSIGSDCHSATYSIDFERTEVLLNSIGLSDADLWRL